MPRGTKKNANQHNNRHENGIVAPAKRIVKQKSNGHLNGSPDGKSHSNTPPIPSPSTLQSAAHMPDNRTNGSLTSPKDVFNGNIRPEELDARLSEDLSEESESQQNGSTYANPPHEKNHRKIDVNAAKNAAVHDGSALSLALTILRSCPLGDTLAILIFLLSLPPTFLTLTNAVFALLAFMPPAGSFSSLPTLNDITSGSPGAPSLTTICITDFVGISLWLIIFTPVQSLALDMAQAVVATTLGGGYSSRKGGSDSTILCMLIVSATHISRYRAQIQGFFNSEWLTRWIPWFVESPITPAPSSGPTSWAWSIASWFRILIALHILVQGLTRMVRRWYVRREYAQAASISKKLDPEAVAGSQTHPESTGFAEQNFNPLTSPSYELATKSSLQSLREPSDKTPNTKRKRRQGTLVRSQQPLWAAFAATKVTVIREYEQSQAISETAASKAIDAKNLGSAPFVLEEGRIWVTLVRPSSFFFDTSYFPARSFHGNDAENLDGAEAPCVDRSNPFYIRINGADWTSTKIQVSPNSESKDEARGQQWTGEVFGLSPSCTYQCTFVQSEDDVVIHSAIVSTPASPIAEQASSSLATPPHQKTRPASPTSPVTTLKNSILAFENSLNDSSARQRRIRKDNKASSTSIKRDIEAYSNSISRVGSNDKSQHSRQFQHSLHARQAEESMATICDELDSLGNVPETESREWKQIKSAWDDERNEQSSTREEVFRSRESNHRDASSVQTEALTTQQKCERLQTRSNKLGDQHGRLQSVSAQGVDEIERRDAEQSIRRRDRDRNETLHKEQIGALVRSVHELHYHSRLSWQQTQALETAFEHQNKSVPSDNRPITPEGDIPGTIPSNAPTSGFRFPAFGSPDPYPTTSHIHSNATSLRHEGTRARSTSMLSGNSIYTDFSDPDPAPPMPSRGAVEAMRAARQHSGSSGSAAGSSPMSPVAGIVFGGKGKGGSPALG